MSETNTVSPLRQRMIEDIAARKLNPHTQRSHISSCKRFAAWLKRSPDTATADDVRRFQLPAETAFVERGVRMTAVGLTVRFDQSAQRVDQCALQRREPPLESALYLGFVVPNRRRQR